MCPRKKRPISVLAKFLYLVVALCLPSLVWATAPSGVADGEVKVPLSDYTRMLEATKRTPRPAPAAYALGQSTVEVKLVEQQDHRVAQVNVAVAIETLEDEWTLVPLLPSGVALTAMTADQRATQLVQGPDGLAWGTDKAGTVTLRLAYSVDARRSEAGWVLPIPVPRAAATALTLSMPGTGHDLAVVPSAGLTVVERGAETVVQAGVPATSSILLSWRARLKRPYAMSRASYEGRLQGEALVWTADYEVEVFSGESITLPLLPADITVSEIRVDGEPATVIEEARRFVTVIDGRGQHHVQAVFQTPVERGQGPPRTRVQVPKVPVSRFNLSLPGRKELKVDPQANVVAEGTDEETRFTVYIPMRDNLVFSWVDAVPEDLRAQVRANANLYHTVHAEEGVLHARAFAVYEITHGETNTLTLEVPAEAQVNRITAPKGGVSDWAVAHSAGEAVKRIDVFLDRAVKGSYVLDVAYERLLGAARESPEPVAVPMLRAAEVHRQRGMVALLAGPELALNPVVEERVSRVGENQLPALVRNQLKMQVAHTYKYTDSSPRLMVETVAPERRQGRFDAQVDTLISIGEVTLKGSASVEVNVKSGTITQLAFGLPANVNVLSVSGPSLRTHEVEEDQSGQTVTLEFTQEMEGQFRVEFIYERIMADAEAETRVPTVSVEGAEVEHGRIAVEALTAVEVRAALTEQLSTVDINELPQQLVLKTTNPILLAYKYVHAEPPFALALKITRHKEIPVLVASIEAASYQTLFTRDGLAMTTARYQVRNSRRQFLRLDLPAGSEVWSVLVDGKPEKPAQAGESENAEGTAVLVKMINSATGFPVEIVYATPGQPMGFMGRVSARLPRPDMVVTRSHWDVYLPVGPQYRKPDTTMDLVSGGNRLDPRRRVHEAMARAAGGQPGQMGAPLRVSVPAQGVHFAFEKLYANQSQEQAGFSIGYVSATAGTFGSVLSVVGVVAIWVGIVGLGRRYPMPRSVAFGALIVGTVLLIGALGSLGTSPVPASVVALVIAAGLGAWAGVQWWRERRPA